MPPIVFLVLSHGFSQRAGFALCDGVAFDQRAYITSLALL